jgi:hypothetical protein
MALTKKQQAYLDRIARLIEKVRSDVGVSTNERSTTKRFRRTSEDAAKMKKQVLAARAKGVSAASLAEKYGVSTAYIYMIKE